MTVRIDELICNVTVTLGAPALPLTEFPPAEAPLDETPSRPPLEQALLGTSPLAEAGNVMGGMAGRQNVAPATGGLLPPNVDANELANRVYRLMRDELAIARERE